jgi:hypothetical protein
VPDTPDTRKEPIASSTDSEEDIFPKPVAGNDSDIVDSNAAGYLSSPADSDGYVVDSGSYISFNLEVIFGNTLYGFYHNQQHAYDGSDECSDEHSKSDSSESFSDVMILDTAEQDTTHDAGMSGMRALLDALKKRVS